MAVENLGRYVLSHHDISFYVDGSTAKQINFSADSGTVTVDNIDRSDILFRDHKKYIDFVFSFDQIQFDSKEDAIHKLSELAKDISKIEINNPKKSNWTKQFELPENFNELNDLEMKIYINNLVNTQYGEDGKGIPEIVNYTVKRNDWGKEVLFVKLRRTYERKITLDNSIISIHTEAGNDFNFEGYDIKPHIHIIIEKNKALGQDYILFRKELYKLFKKHELTSSHNTYIERSEEYREYRILKDRLSAFSWVLSKHEEKEYILKQLNSYKRSDNCIRLDNVEEKLNRYLELDGSYDFARKIQIMLKEKLGIEIDVKIPESYQRAENNIKERNYVAIIDEVRYQALNGIKISERYKEFAKEILQKDNVDIRELLVARAIREVIKHRGFTYGKNYSIVIDEVRINSICDSHIEKIIAINHKEFQQFVFSKIENREYIDQEELRKDLRRAEIRDIKALTGLSEVKIIFEGTEKYIRERIDMSSISSVNDLRNRILATELNMSDNWINQITAKLYIENKVDWKEINNINDFNNAALAIQKELKPLKISEEQLLSINRSLYYDKYSRIKDEVKANINFETINPYNAYKDIKFRIEEMELDISEDWIEKAAQDLYTESGYRAKDIEAYRDNLERTNAIIGGYNSLQKGCEELDENLREVTGKERDTIAVEIKSIKHQIRNYIGLLKQLEHSLYNLISTPHYDFMEKNSLDEIDNLLSMHEEILENYNDKIAELDRQIKQLREERGKAIISIDKEMINQLEKEVKELTIEDEKLTKAIEELEKAENQLLEGYTVKHYEYELEKLAEDLIKLQQNREDLMEAGLLERVFRGNELKDIEEKIEKQQALMDSYRDKISKVKVISNDLEKIAEMQRRIRLLKDRKERELKEMQEKYYSVQKQAEKDHLERKED